MGLLDGLFAIGDTAKKNVRGLLSDPKGWAEQMADQLRNYNRQVVPTISGGQLYNRPMTDEEQYRQAMNLTGLAPLGLTVWHGSPHKFTRFDMSKIGTGEGAQAYGHGLYTAEAKDVGKEYARMLSGKKAADGSALNWDDPASVAAMRLSQFGGDVDKAIQWIKTGDVPGYNKAIPMPSEKATDQAADARKFLLEVIDHIKSGKATPAVDQGYLYKVDIPDEAVARMLDWDKPLSQQAPEVQKALQSMVTDVTSGGFDLSRSPRNVSRAFNNASADDALKLLQQKYGIYNSGGQYFDKNGNAIPSDVVVRHVNRIAGKPYDNAGQLYSDLTHIVGSQSDISATLKNNGIPGIRYLDGGSRGAGGGTSNYVLFSDQLPRILEVNGQPTGLLPWGKGEWQGLLD